VKTPDRLIETIAFTRTPRSRLTFAAGGRPPPGIYRRPNVYVFNDLREIDKCKIVIRNGLWLNSSFQMGCGNGKNRGDVMGLFGFFWKCSISIIAGGVELIGHAKVLDWRGDLRFGGLTGFWVGWIRGTGEGPNRFCGIWREMRGFFAPLRMTSPLYDEAPLWMTVWRGVSLKITETTLRG
jgi:hypothetical protein